MKVNLKLLCIMILACVCLVTCYNPIMDQWWDIEESVTNLSVYHVVKFDANGGWPVPGDQLILHNSNIAKVPPMTRETDGFAGWYTDNSYSREWDLAIDKITEDITLYAKWVLNTPVADPKVIEVHFVTNTTQARISDSDTPDAGDREVLELSIQYIAEGSKIVEPSAIRYFEIFDSITRSYFGFGGWYTDNAYSREWVFAVDTVNLSDAEFDGDKYIIKLYAKWVEEHYKVNFNANNGIPAPRDQEIALGMYVVEPYAMSRIGHGFGGWYRDQDFGQPWNFTVDTTYNNGSIITLYAKWIANSYNITFVSNGGSSVPEQTPDYGTKIVKPAGVTKHETGIDYSLLGWYTDPGFTNEWDFDNDTVTSDMILYARWEISQYTVVFHLGNYDEVTAYDTPVNQYIISHGLVTEPVLPNLITSDNVYGFLRWDYSPDPSVPPSSFVEVSSVRSSLLEWDFSRPVTDVVTNDDNVLNLYARWVPHVSGMVWIQKGSFIMGDSTVSGAGPARRVYLDGFYINTHEVTQAEYIMIMGFNPSNSRASDNHENQPVERVSWFDAIKYCFLRNNLPVNSELSQVYSISDEVFASITGTASTDPLLPFAETITNATVTVIDWNASGYRLPTEAEWEYAARGGNGSPGNFIYAGSNDATTVAWYNATLPGPVHGGIQPVGGKAPNALGLYDMSGNVAEWCWDWFSPYGSMPNPDYNPRGPSIGAERVRRGGSWSNAISNMRSVIRNSDKPETSNWVIGFRVVRSADPLDVL